MPHTHKPTKNPYPNLNIKGKSYRLVHILGIGISGAVALCLDKSGCPHAVKFLQAEKWIVDDEIAALSDKHQLKAFTTADEAQGFSELPELIQNSLRDGIKVLYSNEHNPMEKRKKTESVSKLENTKYRCIVMRFWPGHEMLVESEQLQGSSLNQQHHSSKNLALILACVNALADIPDQCVHPDLNFTNILYRQYLGPVAQHLKAKTIDFGHMQWFREGEDHRTYTDMVFGSSGLTAPETQAAKTCPKKTWQPWENKTKLQTATADDRSFYTKATEVFELGQEIYRKLYLVLVQLKSNNQAPQKVEYHPGCRQ